MFALFYFVFLLPRFVLFGLITGCSAIMCCVVLFCVFWCWYLVLGLGLVWSRLCGSVVVSCCSVLFWCGLLRCELFHVALVCCGS